MMDMTATTKVSHGHGIGEFREAAKGRTAGRSFHQRRSPKPKLYIVPECVERGATETLKLIKDTAQHRSRLVALYLSPDGAVFVLAEDLSPSHQRWARQHESWLCGWYTCTATVEDVRAAIP